jgi:hypothetical protein
VFSGFIRKLAEYLKGLVEQNEIGHRGSSSAKKLKAGGRLRRKDGLEKLGLDPVLSARK